jgi:hypothetical protein
MRAMTETSLSKLNVIVGTPLCRRTAFVLDRFLANQREIQQAYPGCALILATEEPYFVTELKEQIDRYNLRGEAIAFEVVKPDYARSPVWNVAWGREVMRQYALSRGAEYLLCLDSDMTYDPSVISIMKEKIQGFDVVSSGYQLTHWGGWGFGTGCLLINRETLNKITFRCFEFKNGQVIYEDNSLDMDLFACRARVRRGIFVSVKHYEDREHYYAIEPRPMGWFRALTNSSLVRYMIVRMGIMFRYNIAYKLHTLFCAVKGG